MGPALPEPAGMGQGCQLEAGAEDGRASLSLMFFRGHSLEYLPTSYSKATATSRRGFIEFVLLPQLGLVAFLLWLEGRRSLVRFSFPVLQPMAWGLSVSVQQVCWTGVSLWKEGAAKALQAGLWLHSPVLLVRNASPFPSHASAAGSDPKSKSSSHGLLSQMTILSWSVYKNGCHSVQGRCSVASSRIHLCEMGVCEGARGGCPWGQAACQRSLPLPWQQWVGAQGLEKDMGDGSAGVSSCLCLLWELCEKVGSCCRVLGWGAPADCEQRQTLIWWKEQGNVELHLHQLLILLLEAYMYIFLRCLMKMLLRNLHLYPLCSIISNSSACREENSYTQLSAWHMICKVNVMVFCFCELLLTNTGRRAEKKKFGENCMAIMNITFLVVVGIWT